MFMDNNKVELPQRLVGIGIILIGSFSMLCSVSFMVMLWGAENFTLAIFVTLASMLIILFGVAVGFPDYLPSTFVASTGMVLGLISMLLGVLIVAWWCFRLFVWKEPVKGGVFAIVAIGFGYRITVASWSKLKEHTNLTQQ